MKTPLQARVVAPAPLPFTHAELCDLLNRRAEVEEKLLRAARGADPMPDAATLKAWAARLGVPSAWQTYGQADLDPFFGLLDGVIDVVSPRPQAVDSDPLEPPLSPAAVYSIAVPRLGPITFYGPCPLCGSTPWGREACKTYAQAEACMRSLRGATFAGGPRWEASR